MPKFSSKLLGTILFIVYLFNNLPSVSLDREKSSNIKTDQPGKNVVTNGQITKENHKLTRSQKNLYFYTESSGGRFIAVYDGVLGDKKLISLRRHAAENCDWTYAPSNNSTRNAPWLSQILKSDSKVLKLSNIISQFISKNIYNKSSKFLSVRNMKTSVLLRGDFSLVERDVEEPNQTVSAILFLTKTWNKNDYGELVFYGEEGEILKSIHPRFGRLVVFDGSIPRVQRAPSMCISRGILSLIVSFDVVKKANGKSKKQEQKWPEKPEPFVGQVGSSSQSSGAIKTDVTKYITREYKTLDGLKLVIFDDVISKKDIDALRSYCATKAVFQYSGELGYESSDNVQWMTGWEVPDFVSSRYWDIFRPLVNHVSGTEMYYPYDVSLNLIRSYDNTENHRDCPDEHCPTCRDFTLLVYLNRDWSGDMHGETVFFDSNGEVLAAVSPKYGRVALFRGKIWHSARPPTSTFQDARLTFSVKFKPDKETALLFIKEEKMQEG